MFFREATASNNAVEKVLESDCPASLCHVTRTHTHITATSKPVERACALVELVGLVGLARCQSYTHLALL